MQARHGEQAFLVCAITTCNMAYEQTSNDCWKAPITSSVAAYDYRHRRTSKTVQRLHSTIPPPPSPPVGEFEWQTVETRTFVYDGNLPVHETVQRSNGSTVERSYYWGVDKSGTEQGAGGVGGLLAVSINGEFHIPCYDHNGNIVRYVSEAGTTSASYTYDPYGTVVEAEGPLADVFSFGFSTKYHDRETALVSYLMRFYNPPYGRWLNRDPIGEDGGENLYAFCGNNPVSIFDALGTDTCCRDGEKRECERFFKWSGMVTQASLSYVVGLTSLFIDLESNTVCYPCAKYRIQAIALMGALSAGLPVAITGSNISFGDYHPADFKGSVLLVSAGASAMGGVEASYLILGKAQSGSVGMVGGAELGAGVAYGRYIKFDLTEE